MKNLTAIAAALLLSAAPAFAETPSKLPARPGAHVLSYVFGPLVFLAEFQSKLSPEKPSCWNEGSTEVVGCNLIER